MHKKPEPLFSHVPRAVCPVCGITSYSASGVHPQCAMAAADQVLTRRIKDRNNLGPKPAVAELRQYEKRCPRCRAILHVRKRVCDCGHTWSVTNSQ